MSKPYRVLFVCMGNICRSPTAEAVARRKAALAGITDRIEFDSAGTHGYHIGDAPDHRAIAAGARRGYNLSALRARNVVTTDFERFDLVLAMDDANHAHLAKMCPQEYLQRLKRLLDYAPHGKAREVPDPYYGNPEGFDKVIDIIEEGVTGLLAALK
jgi:protein-tyrosine phosphatase